MLQCSLGCVTIIHKKTGVQIHHHDSGLVFLKKKSFLLLQIYCRNQLTTSCNTSSGAFLPILATALTAECDMMTGARLVRAAETAAASDA